MYQIQYFNNIIKTYWVSSLSSKEPRKPLKLAWPSYYLIKTALSNSLLSPTPYTLQGMHLGPFPIRTVLNKIPVLYSYEWDRLGDHHISIQHIHKCSFLSLIVGMKEIHFFLLKMRVLRVYLFWAECRGSIKEGLC